MDHDPRVDAYIARSAAFAQPLLRALRQAVHASHSGINETIKWGMPFFVLDDKPLAHMAAFKRHCAFGFWRGKKLMGENASDAAMGQFGRLTQAADLPDASTIQALVNKALALRAEVMNR